MHCPVVISVCLLLGLLHAAQSIEPFTRFQEGSCKTVRPFPAVGVNPKWISMLRFIPGGSKYFMYRMASPHLKYDSMRDNEFYRDFCLTRNTTLGEGIVSSFGFGQVLESFDILPGNITSGTGEADIYLTAIPRDYFPKTEIMKDRVAFTDNKSFAVLVNCWTESDQKSWSVVSAIPNLGKGMKRRIRNFVKSLGFANKDAVFLHNEDCLGISPEAHADNSSSPFQSNEELRSQYLVKKWMVQQWNGRSSRKATEMRSVQE